MPPDYLYDVFVSYRHEPPVMDWVKNHFSRLLTRWLPSSMPVTPKIFIDTDQIETGAAWPASLREAHKASRCLLAIWSPEYFRSKWCMAEWKSMQKRERMLGLNPAHAGLVYAVTFSDGDHFPPGAKKIERKDLRKWNTPEPVLTNSVDFINFDKEVQKLCDELAKIILKAPAWQNNWPILTPRPVRTVSMSLPRLR